MRFHPFVLNRKNDHVPVTIYPISSEDIAQTLPPRPWQTPWNSNYLTSSGFDCYAAKVGNELVALGAYEVLKNSLVVHIAYMEAQPESNPTMVSSSPKYTGIGRMMIAFESSSPLTTGSVAM